MKKRLNKLHHKILKQDAFPYPIRMEVNETTDGVFRTFPGGIVSILMNIILFWFFAGQFILMATFSNNTI